MIMETIGKPPRIVVCGLARDCLGNLRRNWKSLEHAAADLAELHWIIVENDSTDGTREWLERRAEEDPCVHVIGKPIRRPSIPESSGSTARPWFSFRRIGLMASLRNQYLDHLETLGGPEKFDALLVVDFDVRELPAARLRWWLGNLSVDAAVTAFGTYWRHVFRKGFYDVFAFAEENDPEPLCDPWIQNRRAILYERFRNAAENVPVLSNFNGLALYPATLLSGARYDALPNADPEVECLCEHIAFHRKIIANGGHILLDPRLRVTYSDAISDWKRWLLNEYRAIRSRVGKSLPIS